MLGNKNAIKFLLLISVSLLLPAQVFAQAMTVFGGNSKAKECFRNAEFISKSDFPPGRSLIAPCDYALDHSSMSLSNRAATYANRGILSVRNDEYDAAFKDYEAALRIRPESGEIYVNRGNIFYHFRDFEMAVQDYTEAIELDVVQIHIAYLDRGMAYEHLNNAKLAEANYRLALAAMPNWTLAQGRLERLLAKEALSE